MHDVCNREHLEVNLIVDAAKDRIGTDLNDIPPGFSLEATFPRLVERFQNVVIHELGHAISRRDQDPDGDHGTQVMKADLTDDDNPLGYSPSFVKRLAEKIEGTL